ncbi:MAG: hypothetical protein L0Z55_09360 [Planctomycetes bacterium]|nr:hypothetical protein [Planctomycetota bacterium]
MPRLRFSIFVALSLLSSACAANGPIVPMPPSVCVAQFKPTLITPEAIWFEGKVQIQNQMRGPLRVQKVDYTADLHDKPIHQECFSALEPMRSRGTQTVTLPFKIPMSAIVNQVEDVLAEESIRVGFYGSVFPEGFPAIPFEATVVIPPPKMPEVSIDGVLGDPLDGEFTVFLRVKNKNSFALAFQAIDTMLTLNGKKYDLLRADDVSTVGPGGSCRVGLTMRQTRGKALSMLVNVVKNQSAEFAVGGSISCDTPHGLIQLPIALSATTGGR